MVKCLHYEVIYRCKICSTSPRLYGEKTPSLAACITALINVLEALTFCVCSGNKNSSKLQISSFLLFFSHLPPSLLLIPFLFLLYSPQAFSNFRDLLPLLLRLCWPWNQSLMGTQWPRAEPARCIQMWPHAIVAAFPALNKHSLNSLLSHAFMNFYISCWAFLNCC